MNIPRPRTFVLFMFVCAPWIAALATSFGGVIYSGPQQLQFTAPNAPSGVYRIDLDGTGPLELFNAYCDTASAGGGWMLVLKTTGSGSSQLGYQSLLWTNNNLVNPSSPSLAAGEYKGLGFIAMPASQIMVCFTSDITRSVVLNLNVPVPSLKALFSGGYTATALGRTAWAALTPGATLQTASAREGINATSDTGASNYAAIRLGIIGNDQSNMATPDSFVGIGANLSNSASNTIVGGHANYVTGNSAAYQSYVYARGNGSGDIIYESTSLQLGTATGTDRGTLTTDATGHSAALDLAGIGFDTGTVHINKGTQSGKPLLIGVDLVSSWGMDIGQLLAGLQGVAAGTYAIDTDASNGSPLVHVRARYAASFDVVIKYADISGLTSPFDFSWDLTQSGVTVDQLVVIPEPSIHLLSITRGESNFVVRFEAAQGQRYHLERKTELTAPDWESIPGVNDFASNADGPAQFKFTDPDAVNLGHAFYRVAFSSP